MQRSCFTCSFFFFNDTATTEIYPLSLHDALPISRGGGQPPHRPDQPQHLPVPVQQALSHGAVRQEELHRLHGQRSEEHTSELQSPDHLVCRLLLEKKKKHVCSSLCRGSWT